MTVRNYELSSFRLCVICCEYRECSIPSAPALVLVVEGSPPAPFAVCESCVGNMMQPFAKREQEK